MSHAPASAEQASGPPGRPDPTADGPAQADTSEQARPLGGYAVLTATFAAVFASLGVWIRRSGRELPEHISTGDLALITFATHKLSRLIAKDRVTSAVRSPFTRYQGDSGHGEVEEEARGRGLRRAIGELLICPYCLGLWIAGAFAAGLVLAPRATRWVASVLTALFGSDVLQLAYKKLEETL
jgi:uncharacterized protein DUF1360